MLTSILFRYASPWDHVSGITEATVGVTCLNRTGFDIALYWAMSFKPAKCQEDWMNFFSRYVNNIQEKERPKWIPCFIVRWLILILEIVFVWFELLKTWQNFFFFFFITKKVKKIWPISGKCSHDHTDFPSTEFILICAVEDASCLLGNYYCLASENSHLHWRRIGLMQVISQTLPCIVLLIWGT